MFSVINIVDSPQQTGIMDKNSVKSAKWPEGDMNVFASMCFPLSAFLRWNSQDQSAGHLPATFHPR